MLVLTRKLQQQIKIGDQITVTILRVKGSTVRIGVQAPRDVRVIRGELPKGDGDATPAGVPQSPLEIADIELEPSEVMAVPASAEAAHTTTACAVQPASAQLPPAAHLPLRKIRQRRGNGPLKQMVAASAALAK